MYIILAKLFANRLKLVTNSVVFEVWLALVTGRNFFDGIVISNEVVDEDGRKKDASIIFKVDFKRLMIMLSGVIQIWLWRIGVSYKWRQRIMECLSTINLLAFVNGSPT